MEADDYKKEPHVFKTDQNVVLIKVEIRSATGGSKFYEFGNLAQAQKFLGEIDED